MLTRDLTRAALAVTIVIAAACASNARSTDASSTLPATESIIHLFAKHPLVLLGESHNSAEMQAFVRALIAAPGFSRVVNDIVLEATNVRYQGLLDRYVAGDSVPLDSVRLVWRNSTQLLLWDSPLYEQLVESIRDLNRTLPRERRLRALASDPPIDWSVTKTAGDFPRVYGYRDWQTTEVIEREILSRQRRGLVIFGSTHVRRAGPKLDSLPTPVERETVAEALARLHPGLAYSIETVIGDARPQLTQMLADVAPVNTLVPVAGSALATVNGSVLFGKNVTLFRTVQGRRVAFQVGPEQMPPLAAVVDGFLYLGKYSNTVLPNASLYREDPAYLKEVRRRIEILTQVYGGDFWSSSLDQTLRCGPG